jgi:hypothetical protein
MADEGGCIFLVTCRLIRATEVWPIAHSAKLPLPFVVDREVGVFARGVVVPVDLAIREGVGDVLFVDVATDDGVGGILIVADRRIFFGGFERSLPGD